MNQTSEKQQSPNRICFIATREPDYSRVSITREGLSAHFKVDEITSQLKSYRVRLVVIAIRIVWAWLSGRLRKSDAVFVGFFAQPIFPLVRMLYRGPIVADAYFSLFDTMVNDKAKVKKNSLIGRVCFWLDQYMLRHAELCLTDTQQHVEYMKSQFKAVKAKSADVRRLWISAETEALSKRAEKPESAQPFRVFFWGGFIPLQGIETIVRSAGILKNENVEFTIFGAGQTYSAAVGLKKELGASNIEFCGWQNADKIPDEAERSHVALGIFGTTEKAGRVIPNKAYEALAMGIPLITRKSLASDELFVDGEHVMLVEPDDPQALADKILWARGNYEQVISIADSGRRLFEETCSPTAIGIQLKDEIDGLLKQVGHSVSRKSNSELVAVNNHIIGATNKRQTGS
jgi:glycosyltransferase involved in cell wall biosynthesis